MVLGQERLSLAARKMEKNQNQVKDQKTGPSEVKNGTKPI